MTIGCPKSNYGSRQQTHAGRDKNLPPPSGILDLFYKVAAGGPQDLADPYILLKLAWIYGSSIAQYTLHDHKRRSSRTDFP